MLTSRRYSISYDLFFGGILYDLFFLGISYDIFFGWIYHCFVIPRHIESEKIFWLEYGKPFSFRVLVYSYTTSGTSAIGCFSFE